MDLGIIEKLAKCIVRPPRAQYKAADLVPPCFELKGKVYDHKTFEVVNNRSLKLKGSYIKDRSSKIARQTIVFLHANGSCRVNMKNYIELYLAQFDIVAFDFAGCGLSEGQYITLGYNQREDVYTIVNHIRKEFGITAIYLWGRSMGAATAILYTAKYGGIKGIICDNSYADLDKLISELSDDYLPFLPSFLVDGVINAIQQYIEQMIWKKESTDFNIRKLKPSAVVDKITCPIIYVGSTEDTFVNVKHTHSLYEKTKSWKRLELVKGNHNDPRTSETKLMIMKYLMEIRQGVKAVKRTNSERYQIFKEVGHANIEKKTTINPDSGNTKSPFEVKLVNCAEIEHKTMKSPLLNKNQQKISKDLASNDTSHSEKKPRESYFERRLKMEEMSKRMRTRSKLKRKKIFEGIQYISQHLNGQDD